MVIPTPKNQEIAVQAMVIDRGGDVLNIMNII
jgi:hypothetical protein